MRYKLCIHEPFASLLRKLVEVVSKTSKDSCPYCLAREECGLRAISHVEKLLVKLVHLFAESKTVGLRQIHTKMRPELKSDGST